MTHDRLITISTGGSRRANTVPRQPCSGRSSWSACALRSAALRDARRVSKHEKGAEDDIKDVGGFVVDQLAGGSVRRTPLPGATS